MTNTIVKNTDGRTYVIARHPGETTIITVSDWDGTRPGNTHLPRFTTAMAALNYIDRLDTGRPDPVAASLTCNAGTVHDTYTDQMMCDAGNRTDERCIARPDPLNLCNGCDANVSMDDSGYCHECRTEDDMTTTDPLNTTIKRTYELEPGDRLAFGGEVVSVARVIDHDTDYAVTFRWTSTHGTNHIGARVESMSMTWEVTR